MEILTESGSFPIQEIEVSSSSSPANRNTMAGVSSAASGQEGLYLLISRYHETNASSKGELQPTYADHFANSHLRGKRVVLSNADIAFTPSLGKLGDHPLSSERRVLILSRWALDCREGGERRT